MSDTTGGGYVTDSYVCNIPAISGSSLKPHWGVLIYFIYYVPDSDQCYIKTIHGLIDVDPVYVVSELEKMRSKYSNMYFLNTLDKCINFYMRSVRDNKIDQII